MKIELTYGTNWDDLEWQEMTAITEDGKTKGASVYPLCECPEDAIIGRSLISCEDIIDLMELAYAAGKAGESFTVTKTKESEEE